MSDDCIPMVPVSVGELIDKITILMIKHEHIADAEKRANVRRELDALRAVREAFVPAAPEISEIEADLLEANRVIWGVEDAIREHERDGVFDERFIALARKAYTTNDVRAALKRRLNGLTRSALVEEKSYAGR